MTAAQTLVLVGFFVQGSDANASPVAQLMTHSVPRAGDWVLLEGQEWRVARVTWMPLDVPDQPPGLAATVTVWDPRVPGELPGLDSVEIERLSAGASHCVASADTRNRWDNCTAEDPCPLCSANLDLAVKLKATELELEDARHGLAAAADTACELLGRLEALESGEGSE